MNEVTDALISFSNHCNLDCHYCFVSKERLQRLSWKKVESFLVWFLNQPAPFKRIGIAGGEPLLEIGLIKKTFSFLKKNKIYDFRKITMSDIVTNGTILNAEIIDFLKKEKTGLNFSLDGDRQSNRNRIFKNGKGCYDAVWKNMAKYRDEISRDPIISITIAPNNADKFFSNIKFLFDNGFYRIKFSPTVASDRWPDCDVDIFINESKKVIKYYRLLKKTKKDASLYFLDELSKKMKDQGFFNCSLGRQVVLSYDGHIYACPLVQSFDRESKELVKIGSLPGTIGLKKLESLRSCDCLKNSRFKNSYNHPYIRDIGRMQCLLFEKHGVLADDRHVKSTAKLFLQINKEINQAF